MLSDQSGTRIIVKCIIIEVIVLPTVYISDNLLLNVGFVHFEKKSVLCKTCPGS